MRTVLIVFGLFALASCTRENLLESKDAILITSADSLHFDTIFTQAGSITLHLVISNPNDQRVKLSNISLAGGDNSFFRININGDPGPALQNLDIRAGDSIHVFVNTRIPSQSNPLPFLVQDSIRLDWNGNTKWVQLDVWGQQARFIRNGYISQNQTWTRDIPYVLLGPLSIANGATLTLQKGTRVYAHADAPILVDGSLRVNGGPDSADRVVFRGDRLDAPYRNFPASWPGILFREGSDHNRLDYAIISNAYQGIVTQVPGGPSPSLELNQCIIENAWDAGLQAVSSNIVLNNCLISNCGKNVQLVYGGTYLFNQCTIAAYNTIYFAHEEPAVWVTDAITVDNNIYVAPLDAQFINCIVWGDGALVNNELEAERKGEAPYSVIFENGLWRMKEVSSFITTINAITNEDPLFEKADSNPLQADFHLQAGSPAIGKGRSPTLPVDLDGKTRYQPAPDIGAYERQ